MSDELKTEQTELVELTAADQELNLLASEIEGKVYDMTTTSGRGEATADRAKLRAYWVDLGKTSKSMKAHLNNIKKRIDSKTEELTTKAKQIAEPIDSQIKEYEAEAERIRLEKKEAERKRVADIQNVIQSIAAVPAQFQDMGSEAIRSALVELEAYEVNESFQEFQDQAKSALANAITQTQELFDKVKDREEADAARKIEAERLAEEKAKLEAERAAFEAEQAEARAKAEEAEKAKQAKAEALDREDQVETAVIEEPTAMRQDIEEAKEVLATEPDNVAADIVDNWKPLSDRLHSCLESVKLGYCLVFAGDLQEAIAMALEVEAKGDSDE